MDWKARGRRCHTRTCEGHDTHRRTQNESNRLFGKIEEGCGRRVIIVVVCVAYGGEGCKSRLQVTRCQGGWPKGLKSGFGFLLVLLPRQLLGAEVIFVFFMTRVCLATLLSIMLLTIVSPGSLAEEELMRVGLSESSESWQATEYLGSLTCHS